MNLIGYTHQGVYIFAQRPRGVGEMIVLGVKPMPFGPEYVSWAAILTRDGSEKSKPLMFSAGYYDRDFQSAVRQYLER